MCIILFFLSSVFCTDYFVDSVNGSDTKSGLSSEDAWKTITYALMQVDGSESDPAILHLAEGNYSPSTGEVFPLELKDYIAFYGSGKEKTIVDAEETEIIIKCESVTYAGLFELTLKNGYGDYGGGIIWENYRVDRYRRHAGDSRKGEGQGGQGPNLHKTRPPIRSSQIGAFPSTARGNGKGIVHQVVPS